MKKALIIWLVLSGAQLSAQDLKDASSDKTALLEGRLRGSKPTIEEKMNDGSAVSIWILPVAKPDGTTENQVVKAQASNNVRQANAGIKTTTTDFHYENGLLLRAQHNETVVVQNPSPVVTTSKKEFLYKDGVMTSPAAGSAPEIEPYLNECLAFITKACKQYVSTR